MRDAARSPAALKPLERLQVQRSRLADRMWPPWWGQAGAAIPWALLFAGPFTSPSFSSPRAVNTWAILVPALAVCCLVQWGVARATGIKVGFRNLSYRPGRPAGIAMIVVGVAALGTETSLIRYGPLAAAIAVAALAVAAEAAAQHALLRAICQDLRGGGGAA